MIRKLINGIFGNDKLATSGTTFTFFSFTPPEAALLGLRCDGRRRQSTCPMPGHWLHHDQLKPFLREMTSFLAE